MTIAPPRHQFLPALLLLCAVPCGVSAQTQAPIESQISLEEIDRVKTAGR